MTHQLPPYCKILHEVAKPLVHSSIRAMHHSVYEASYLPLNPGGSIYKSRFALLWDEDHDLRVFSAVAALAESGLLPYVAVIGERKAGVMVILNKHFTDLHPCVATISGEVDLSQFESVITARVELDHGDEWFTRFYLDNSVINYSNSNEDGTVSKYLDLLDVLWDLQIKRL